MGTLSGTCEILESSELGDSELGMDNRDGDQSTSEKKYSIEDDINNLFQAIEIRNSARSSRLSHEFGKDPMRKSAMKRPMKAGSPYVSGIGISGSVSLKQALRGLCISQASEMAAQKRSLKPAGPPELLEAGTIKRLYRAVVAEANGSGLPITECKGNLVEISVVPDTSKFSGKIYGSMNLPKAEISQTTAQPSTDLAKAVTQDKMMTSALQQDVIVHLPIEVDCDINTELRKLESANSTPINHACKKSKQLDEVASTSTEVPSNSTELNKGWKGKLQLASFLSGSSSSSRVSKSFRRSPTLIKPIFRSKSCVKNEVKQDSPCASCSTDSNDRDANNDLNHGQRNLENKRDKCTSKPGREPNEKTPPMSGHSGLSTEVDSGTLDMERNKLESSSGSKNRTNLLCSKMDHRSRSREKGDFSQSSKSSIGDYNSSCTGTTSDESNVSGSSRSGKRPHMSRDLRWEAIHNVQKLHGRLGMRHFKLLRRLGCGDIGTVYLAELTGTKCLFALKVMDNEFLVTSRKLLRAETEREILEMLDHPFLPTLYAHFVSDKLLCLAMEYCPGGDLHVLRQKQPTKSFSEQATR